MQGRHIILIQLASSEGLSKGGLFPKGTLSSLLWHDLHSCSTCVRTQGLRVNSHETQTNFKVLSLSRWPVQLKFRLPRDNYRRSLAWAQAKSTWGAWSTIWRCVEPLFPGVEQEAVQLLTAPAAGRMAGGNPASPSERREGSGAWWSDQRECVSTRLLALGRLQSCMWDDLAPARNTLCQGGLQEQQLVQLILLSPSAGWLNSPGRGVCSYPS